MILERRCDQLTVEKFLLLRRSYQKDMTYAPYTTQGLRTVHQEFRNTPVRALQTLLEILTGSKLLRNTVESLQMMIADCTVWEKTSTAHRDFKLTIGTACLCFRHPVQINTMFIPERHPTQVVDETTLYAPPLFCWNQSTNRTSNRIYLCDLLSNWFHQIFSWYIIEQLMVQRKWEKHWKRTKYT